MYKKAAIAVLIIAPLVVDLATRAVPDETPPAIAENAAPAPETASAPPKAPPPPSASQAGDEPLATMSTEPTLDTSPKIALGSRAEPTMLPSVPQTPALGSSQPATPQASFEPVPISSEKQTPR